MQSCFVLDKKVGETPLAAIQAWKVGNPEYADKTACYAGRLDPMASGKLLVLLGDECKRLRAYTGLDKEYEIEVLLDVGSDTGDALGIVTLGAGEISVDKQVLKNILMKERGAHERAYPSFSSKTVNGKPLFLHALEGALPYMVVPTHVERIYNIRNMGSDTISLHDLEKRISQFLELVPHTDEPSKRLGADFRIDAVRAQWRALFEKAHERNFTVLQLKVACASGTYMRSFAGRIGTMLGTNGLALSISRTKIGTYVPIWNGVGLWVCTY